MGRRTVNIALIACTAVLALSAGHLWGSYTGVKTGMEAERQRLRTRLEAIAEGRSPPAKAVLRCFAENLPSYEGSQHGE